VAKDEAVRGIQLLPTHIEALDEILGGGLPVYSCTILAGKPGAGKTVLAQQILFHHIHHNPAARALYLTTLSEPRAKVVRFIQPFAFFDAEAFGGRVVYQDVARLLRGGKLSAAVEPLLQLVEQHSPEVLVIDSFRAVRDLAGSPSEFRTFCYDLAERLAGARCTSILVGEYERNKIPDGAEFAVADGILYLDLADRSGEPVRSLQVLKMRGQPADLRPCPFVLNRAGVTVLHPCGPSACPSPGSAPPSGGVGETALVSTGIAGLDALLDGGIPAGRTVILSGVSGAGKTIAATQFLVHGARLGERSLLVSFEEAPEQLRLMARGFGWDLAGLEAAGLLRVLHVPQGDIRLMEHLTLLLSVVEEFRPRRVVVDSFSVFLYRVTDPGVQREMTYRLGALFRQAGAVGVLVSDLTASQPGAVSRFGVEETVADGTIVLSGVTGERGRRRYLEVHKMRDRRHATGRQRMLIGPDGVHVLYERPAHAGRAGPAPPLSFPPLDGVVRGPMHHGAAWLVRGTAGAGKSLLACQFAAEGLRQGERVVFVTADAPAASVVQDLQNLGCPAREHLAAGSLVTIDLAGPDPVDGSARDPEVLLFFVRQRVERAEPPVRLVIDSLWPLASALPAHDFVDLVQRKNVMLRGPGVSMLDTELTDTLDPTHAARMVNAYDAVVELSEGAGDRPARLRVWKLRGMQAAQQSYPYRIVPGRGLVVGGPEGPEGPP
jgi:circadian clock protein KaiC